MHTRRIVGQTIPNHNGSAADATPTATPSSTQTAIIAASDCPNFCGETSSPATAVGTKCVRTNSRILHQNGTFRFFPAKHYGYTSHPWNCWLVGHFCCCLDKRRKTTRPLFYSWRNLSACLQYQPEKYNLFDSSAGFYILIIH